MDRIPLHTFPSFSLGTFDNWELILNYTTHPYSELLSRLFIHKDNGSPQYRQKDPRESSLTRYAMRQLTAQVSNVIDVFKKKTKKVARFLQLFLFLMYWETFCEPSRCFIRSPIFDSWIGWCMSIQGSGFFIKCGKAPPPWHVPPLFQTPETCYYYFYIGRGQIPKIKFISIFIAELNWLEKSKKKTAGNKLDPFSRVVDNAHP